MASIFDKFRQKPKYKKSLASDRSKNYKRIKTSTGSVIVDQYGRKEPPELIKIKTDLDSQALSGHHSKDAEKELKRLGFSN